MCEVFWHGLNGYYFEKLVSKKNIHSKMMVNVIIRQFLLQPFV
jgi:hypothetical protein